MDSVTASFRPRPGAKVNNSHIHPSGLEIEELAERKAVACLFFLTELETNVTKAHWKFLLPSLSIFLNFKPSNLDLNVTKKEKKYLVGLESGKKKKKKLGAGGDSAYTNPLSSRHVNHSIYFSKCRESEKHHFCL